MKMWEEIKNKAKAVLEAGGREYIPFPDMVEEIEAEWAAKGLHYKLVGVPARAKVYEAMPMH